MIKAPVLIKCDHCRSGQFLDPEKKLSLGAHFHTCNNCGRNILQIVTKSTYT